MASASSDVKGDFPGRCLTNLGEETGRDKDAKMASDCLGEETGRGKDAKMASDRNDEGEPSGSAQI